MNKSIEYLDKIRKQTLHKQQSEKGLQTVRRYPWRIELLLTNT